MAKARNNNATTKEEPIEKQLWKAADKLRKNIDAAEYKHIVLGLIYKRKCIGRAEADRDALRRAVCLDTTASPSLGNRN
jgi:type I restriction-modification system DNA methylase subunit